MSSGALRAPLWGRCKTSCILGTTQLFCLRGEPRKFATVPTARDPHVADGRDFYMYPGAILGDEGGHNPQPSRRGECSDELSASRFFRDPTPQRIPPALTSPIYDRERYIPFYGIELGVPYPPPFSCALY